MVLRRYYRQCCRSAVARYPPDCINKLWKARWISCASIVGICQLYQQQFLFYLAITVVGFPVLCETLSSTRRAEEVRSGSPSDLKAREGADPEGERWQQTTDQRLRNDLHPFGGASFNPGAASFAGRGPIGRKAGVPRVWSAWAGRFDPELLGAPGRNLRRCGDGAGKPVFAGSRDCGAARVTWQHGTEAARIAADRHGFAGAGFGLSRAQGWRPQGGSLPCTAVAMLLPGRRQRDAETPGWRGWGVTLPEASGCVPPGHAKRRIHVQRAWRLFYLQPVAGPKQPRNTGPRNDDADGGLWPPPAPIGVTLKLVVPPGLRSGLGSGGRFHAAFGPAHLTESSVTWGGSPHNQILGPS